jgi:hypothetical protein
MSSVLANRVKLDADYCMPFVIALQTNLYLSNYDFELFAFDRSSNFLKKLQISAARIEQFIIPDS